MHYLRLIYIIWVVLWFRLDTFIAERASLKPLHTLIKIAFFWRKSKDPRGLRLRLALQKLGPIFVKFGQMLSTRRDLLPQDVADELTKLQDQVPPFDFSDVQKTIETAFNQPLSAIYTQFEQTPVASASVAQVHFAQLHDGTNVAVKVLRPGIAKTINQDIQILKSLAWGLQKLSPEVKRLKPLEVVQEFARHTQHELDLTLEAANCSRIKRNFSAPPPAFSRITRPNLLVPEIYWDFCRKEVMTMQRMHGTPISQIDTLRAKGHDLRQIAHTGVQIFLNQVYCDGLFHADMHPGNILVTDEGQIVLLDFGIVGALTETDKYYLARNFLAFFNRDYRDVAKAHIESGWVPADTNIDEFESAIYAVCEPIFDKPLQEISFGRTLLSLFQMARRFGVVIQPQLVMLQKTLFNIEGLGRQLDPEIDLWQTAKPFYRYWMSEQMGPRKALNTLKKELPYLIKTAPEMPRLLHQFLTQQSQPNQHEQLNDQLKTLIATQSQQARWQKRLTWATVGLIALQALVLMYVFCGEFI